jgi:hypothetical protein
MFLDGDPSLGHGVVPHALSKRCENVVPGAPAGPDQKNMTEAGFVAAVLHRRLGQGFLRRPSDRQLVLLGPDGGVAADLANPGVRREALGLRQVRPNRVGCLEQGGAVP